MSIGKGKIKEALDLAGSEHKYQWIIILLICFTWIQVNYMLLGPTLIYMDPIFNCDSTGDKVVQQNEACPILYQCKIINSFSITAELELYCDKQWARDTIQTIFSVGSFIGLIVMNFISDAKGRKKALLVSLSVAFSGTISSFLGAFFHVIPLVIIGQFLCGFGAYSIVTLCYTLMADFCSDSMRSRAIVITNSIWGFSTIMLGVYYLTELSWKYYLIFIILIPLIILSSIFYVYLVESPYILFNQNKPEQAIFSLGAIAIKNDRKSNISEIRRLVYAQQKRDESNEASFKNVLKTLRLWKNLKPMILITIIYATGSLNFYGVAFSLGIQGYGYGYNSIIAGSVEMISFVYLNFAVNNLPRKKGVPLFYSISILVGLSFFFSEVSQNQLVSTLVLALGRIAATTSYTLVACLQIQSFEVEIQSTSAGLIEAFSLFGVFLAPLIVDISDKIGINPIALISLVLINTIWPNIFLKQTLIKKIPQKQNLLLKDFNDKQNIQNQVAGQTIITQDLTSKSQ